MPTQRGDQVDRVEVSGALDVQGNLQRLAADVRRGNRQTQAPGMLGKTQVQARVVEFMALLRLVGQPAAAGKPAQLAVFDGLAGFQVEKIRGAVAQVVDIGLGQREHPLRGGDAPVVPAFAPADVTGQRAVDLWPRRPADGLRIELPLCIAQGDRGRRLWINEAVHRTRPCALHAVRAEHRVE